MISQPVECERRQDAQLPVNTQPALRCFDRKIFEGERGSVEGEPSIEVRKGGLVLGMRTAISRPESRPFRSDPGGRSRLTSMSRASTSTPAGRSS